MSLTHADIRALAQLAVEAGNIILAIRRAHEKDENALGAKAKDDGSPVTRADVEAQAYILAGIEKLGLQAPIIAEESAPVPIDKNGAFYLIDPLDGTRAFVAGGDDFTVNIGFVEKGIPVCGVIHVPVLHETTYCTEKAAYLCAPSGEEVRVTARLAPAAGLDVIVNRTEDWSGKLKRYLEGYNVRELHRRSSAHKLALVAQGKFDLYPRFGPTYEWDIAAGHAILNAAGGSLTQIDDSPMAYGKSGFKNPPFVARGKP